MTEKAICGRFCIISILCSLWWQPLLQTAIGGLIGAGGAIGAGAFNSWFTRQQERQSVAAALAGEVQGLIDIINQRKACEGLLAGRKFPIDDHPFLVFEATVDKIGLLPPKLAGKVAGFFSDARGIVVDFRTLYKGEFPDNFSETVFRTEVVANIKTALLRGEALVSDLQKEAARDWREVLQPTQSG